MIVSFLRKRRLQGIDLMRKTELLLHGIEGIRLQPMVDLKSGKQQGCEVLSLLAPPMSYEDFFQTLPPEASLVLFFRQLDTLKQLNEPGPFFLNLPVRVLSDPDCIRRLRRVRTCYHRNLVIELQDPEELLSMDDCQKNTVKEQMQKLRTKGWSIWLDDLTPDIWGGIKNNGFWFDGVKTDWREMTRRTLPNLVKQARQLGRKILVEGVETEKDLIRASASGAELGQGFLWPDKLIPFKN